MLKVMLYDSSRLPPHLFAFICREKQALKTNSSPKSQNLPEKVMLGPQDLQENHQLQGILCSK